MWRLKKGEKPKAVKGEREEKRRAFGIRDKPTFIRPSGGLRRGG